MGTDVVCMHWWIFSKKFNDNMLDIYMVCEWAGTLIHMQGCNGLGRCGPK